MERVVAWLLCWIALLSNAAITAVSGAAAAGVTYDGRSLIINGQRKILFSGSIHYPRSTPEMWPSLISKAKEGGIDVIETYVFWNLHEPKYGQYDFNGRNDIIRFIKEIQSQGLYACVRIGPFIESEWNYGGLPFWLHDVPGIVYRSDNEPFKFHMQNFTTKIVNMLKAENLYASQGGPIILSQIENEYQNVEKAFREKGPPYVRWAAEMAVGLQTGVPWVMCKQDDAPDPVINTCNGRRCGETFVGPNSPNKPAIWTENWTSFLQTYGQEVIIRSAEDIAFHVALWIAKNGSFVNYYMYHGGTNFGRTGAAYIITSYYDQAPLDEYGMIRQPKWGHLKELHAAIKLCSDTLLNGAQTNFSFYQLQQAYVFREENGKCTAFLINNDVRKEAVVIFQNISFTLPPESISILPDCKTVAFNTAKVNAQYNSRTMQPIQRFDSPEKWQEYKEAIPYFDWTEFKANTLLEQMGATKDVSDYLWYTFKFYSDFSDNQSVLNVNSLGHVLYAFVNGKFIGSAHGSKENITFTLQNTIYLEKGMNNISLLSVMVGLPDSGAYLERRFAGLHSVKIQGNSQAKDVTNYKWGYQVGLLGEKQEIYTDSGSSKVQWSTYENATHQPLTWYKTYFDAPMGTGPLALNLWSMGKGEAWVNGQSIGRYWVSFHTPKGNPSQVWYNVPRSFLKPTGNLLVLQEEEYGNPLGISIDTPSITKVCGHVSASHPPPVTSWMGQKNHGRRPKIQLRCPPTKIISNILFASFGTPSGDCGNYSVGSCHSVNSREIVEKACLGKTSCSIIQSNKNFGRDPCEGMSKALLVDAECR